MQKNIDICGFCNEKIVFIFLCFICLLTVSLQSTKQWIRLKKKDYSEILIEEHFSKRIKQFQCLFLVKSLVSPLHCSDVLSGNYIGVHMEVNSFFRLKMDVERD